MLKIYIYNLLGKTIRIFLHPKALHWNMSNLILFWSMHVVFTLQIDYIMCYPVAFICCWTCVLVTIALDKTVCLALSCLRKSLTTRLLGVMFMFIICASPQFIKTICWRIRHMRMLVKSKTILTWLIVKSFKTLVRIKKLHVNKLFRAGLEWS